MCVLEPNIHVLIWIFLAGVCAMAVLSRKLNEHLLVPPPPPKHLWFRKKNHIKPSYLLKPDLYFDAIGCRWAWRFTLVAAFSGAAFLLTSYIVNVCR